MCAVGWRWFFEISVLNVYGLFNCFENRNKVKNRIFGKPQTKNNKMKTTLLILTILLTASLYKIADFTIEEAQTVSQSTTIIRLIFMFPLLISVIATLFAYDKARKQSKSRPNGLK